LQSSAAREEQPVDKSTVKRMFELGEIVDAIEALQDRQERIEARLRRLEEDSDYEDDVADMDDDVFDREAKGRR
jgi:hypothetical protein